MVTVWFCPACTKLTNKSNTISQIKDVATEFCCSFANETEEVLSKMDNLTSLGLRPIDALHIACAIFLRCDYFLTVDKGILKKSAEISQTKIINPINLISEWGV